jgi:hypothetical protein
MHVYGGIFAIPKYHEEMSLGIPQPGKGVVLTPWSIWSHPLVWYHIFTEELSGFALSAPIYRVKLDPVFPACNLFDGFQSAKTYYIAWGWITNAARCTKPITTPMTQVSALMRTLTFWL